MESINAAVWIGMTEEELDFLESTLRESAVMVPGNYADAHGPRLHQYMSQSKLAGVEFRALLDRNLVSPIARLAAGAPVPADPQQERLTRLACAVLAFCIWAEILVEPAMALYEFASSAGNEGAQDELRRFRVADNADPRVFLDLAMGRIDAIPAEHLSEVKSDPGVLAEPSREHNFSKSLNMWRPNYLYVLKSFDLIRSGLEPVQAAEALLRWQSEETFYAAAASVYCLAAMSHKPPRGGMLKGIRSQSAKTVRSGALNATWDICLLQQFGRYVTTPRSPSWSLWSDDAALRAMAQSLFVLDGQSERDRMSRYYADTWGKHGAGLMQMYERLTASAGIGTMERTARTQAARARIDDDIRELELRLGILGL